MDLLAPKVALGMELSNFAAAPESKNIFWACPEVPKTKKCRFEITPFWGGPRGKFLFLPLGPPSLYNGSNFGLKTPPVSKDSVF